MSIRPTGPAPTTCTCILEFSLSEPWSEMGLPVLRSRCSSCSFDRRHVAQATLPHTRARRSLSSESVRLDASLCPEDDRVVRQDLPTGTVTFLFTDVEGSTKLLHELGAERYAEALAEHRQIVRDACAASDGVEVDTQGDAFFFAFPTAPGALAAAFAFTEALAPGPIRVRVGLHTGTPLVTDEGYVGGDVHRAARIAAAGYGGQVLVSSSTARLVDLELADLGEHRLKDLSAPERIFQLGRRRFPRAQAPSTAPTCPSLQRPSWVREQELADVLSLLSSEGHASAHTDGTGRNREDPPRAPGRRRGVRPLPRRRVVGPARSLARARARRRERKPRDPFELPAGHLRSGRDPLPRDPVCDQ